MIDAGGGNNAIHYFGGNDRFELGHGNDVVIVHEGQDGNVVTITGGGPGDVLDLTAYDADHVTVEGAKITVQLDDGGSFVIHANGVGKVLVNSVETLSVPADVDLGPLRGGEAEWSDEFLDDLSPDLPDMGFVNPWQTLDQAEELVELGLDASSQPIFGIPVLSDVIQLDAVSDSPVVEPLLLESSDLIPVVAQQNADNPTPVEVRWPVYPADTSAEGADDAGSNGAMLHVSSGGVAALWGLLRGFAGMRFRERGDDM